MKIKSSMRSSLSAMPSTCCVTSLALALSILRLGRIWRTFTHKMVERIDEEWTTRFTELRFDLVGFKNIFVVLKDDLKCPLTMPTTHLEIWRKLYKRVNELGIVLKILSLIKFESFN